MNQATRHFVTLTLAVGVISAGVASCGSNADPTNASASRSAAMKKAASGYADCMRNHGVPMLDPEVTGNGVVVRVDPKHPVDALSPVYLAAQSACQPLYPGAQSAGSPGATR